MNGLIGFTGFVGGNLLAQREYDFLYNSSNFTEMAGRHFTRLVCAGVAAVKWQANKNPAADWEKISALMDVLKQVRADKFILISTIDVYADTCGHDETFDNHTTDNHAYGTHRLRFEDFCREHFPQCLIVRLPGLFGNGLKKNVIYDLLHCNCLDMINPASGFQYYYLKNLSDDIELAEKAGLSRVNLFTEPVTTRDIISEFFPGVTVGGAAVNEAHYDLRTCHGKVWGRHDGFCRGKAEVMAELGEFIAAEKLMPFNLAVSNIAWERHDDPQILLLLKKYGVRGIEVAPTKIWPDWQGVSAAAGVAYREKMARAGFSIPAMQSILFGRNDLQLFDPASHTDFLAHLRLVCELAHGLGARVLVFGAPKNRRRGMLSHHEAMAMAADFLRRAGELCQEYGCVLGVEANPAEYGCDFVTNVADALELVTLTASPGVQLHFDTGAVKLNGGDLAAALGDCGGICHYHISEPQLGLTGGSGMDHAAGFRRLRSVGYKNWVSVEMRMQSPAAEGLEQALQTVRRAFADMEK